MRRLILLIIALATLLPSLAFGYDVLILQSSSAQSYDEVLKGFNFKQKSSLRLLVLSDYAEVDVVRIVREDRPRLILAVGDIALAATRKIRNTPIVSVVALGIHKQRASQQNLTGINMFAPPERYISMFKSMKARRVGIIYNPSKSGWYLSLARQAASAAGIELVAREVSAPRETIAQLQSLSGKVDALWMLPDSTAITQETTESYFRFAQSQLIPAIAFSANYLRLGAAAVVEIDRVAIGQQAGALATKLLNGDDSDMPLVFPENTDIKTNPNVLKQIGSSIEEAMK